MATIKRIACFFTGGYTELNAMKYFIKKINPKNEYIQLCPTGVRKSSRAIKNRDLTSIDNHINGLTGSKLIEYVLKIIKTPKFHEEHYDAILIEDDKDNRFLKIMQDGGSNIDSNAWNAFKKDLREKIHKELDMHVPVIILLAAPEVEAWFVSDWDNSFAKIYKDCIAVKQNNFFSIIFRKFVNNKILTKLYMKNVEAYGYFSGKYVKLSEKIQDALRSLEFLHNNPKSQEIDKRVINYSKRTQGATMLFQIEPDIVLHSCNYFFKECYSMLKNF